jgi:hypothetical protein
MSFIKNSTTRREFVKELAVGSAGLAAVGSLSPCAAAAPANQYAHFVHKLNFKKGTGGPGGPDYYFNLSSDDMNGCYTNWSFGYYSKAGAYNNEFHTHPYDSVLTFAGMKYERPDYFSAEIEVTLGQEGEKYVITQDTIVCIPAGLPHGLITARKVEGPYVHYDIGLARPCWAGVIAPPSTAATTKKYEHLIKPQTMPSKPGGREGSGNADAMFWPKGAALENFDINYTWEFCSRTGPFHAQGMDPHVHVGDELLVFVGLDPNRPQYLGATLDIYMGEDERSGHKQELYTIDAPTIVVCPSTFPHCPLIVKKVDTPYS